MFVPACPFDVLIPVSEEAFCLLYVEFAPQAVKTKRNNIIISMQINLILFIMTSRYKILEYPVSFCSNVLEYADEQRNIGRVGICPVPHNSLKHKMIMALRISIKR